MKVTEDQVLRWLDEVKDPEIPVLSLVDLGVINSITIEGQSVNVEMTPTFVGCPALDVMKLEVVEMLQRKGVANPNVYVSFRRPWTSDRISEKGRKALGEYGLAPPPSAALFQDLDILENAVCPRCKGSNTELRNTFGTTLCRSLYFCNTCREAFEQFKPI